MIALFLAAVLSAAPEPSRLQELPGLLQSQATNVDYSWVVELGDTAIPELVKLAGDKQLPAQSRNLALILLGNTMNKVELREHPDKRNDSILPVLFESLGDGDANVRGAAAYACRFISDARLVPALEPLLKEKPATQEQAVLALGSNGGAAQVLTITRLFYETENGVFRFSCASALSMLALDHGVDVAAMLHSNTTAFGEAHVANVEFFASRFDELKQLAELLKGVSATNQADREKACLALRRQARAKIPCNDKQKWRDFLLRGYWKQPAPTKPVPARP